MNENVVKIKEYNGYIIQFNLSFQRFEAVTESGEKRLDDSSEANLEKKIDAALKRAAKASKTNLFPMDVIWIRGIAGYSSTDETNIITATITSITEDGGVWISYQYRNETKRSKETLRYSHLDLYPVTDKNLDIVAALSGKRKLALQIVSEISNLERTFEKPIDIKAIVEKLKDSE